MSIKITPEDAMHEGKLQLKARLALDQTKYKNKQFAKMAYSSPKGWLLDIKGETLTLTAVLKDEKSFMAVLEGETKGTKAKAKKTVANLFYA